MRHDPDDAAALPQPVEDVHDLVEGVLVESPEALVDEQRADAGAAGFGGDDIGESQGQRERGQERLAAGQRRGVTVLPGPAVPGK